MTFRSAKSPRFTRDAKAAAALTPSRDPRPFTVAVTGLNAGESPQPGPALARSLRCEPDFTERGGRIIGLLYDAMESGVYADGLIDEAFLVPYPSAGTDSLRARLDDVFARCPCDVLIPTLDAELPAYIKLAPHLKTLGVHVFLPTESQLEARSKARLADLCASVGIPAPRQTLVWSLDQLPLLLAEYGGTGVVKGVYYEAGTVHSAADAAKVGHKISAKWGLPIILQERITGEEYDLALVGDGRGNVLGAVGIKKMALTEKGKAFGGMTISDERLFAIGRQFIKHTKWRGPLELEFVKPPDGDYHLIEVNPRFPAWIYLACQVGQNLPWAVTRLALGESVDPFPAYVPGRFFVRHAIDIVADLARLEQLTVTGELRS